MLIHVTQSHIDRGCRGDGLECPVALAIAEAMDGYNAILVESAEISDIGASCRRWRTPGVVAAFIESFDTGLPVEPFEFELDVEGVG